MKSYREKNGIINPAAYIKKLNKEEQLVEQCIFGRSIVFKKGKFYGVLQNGTKIIIDKSMIKQYITDMLTYVVNHNVEEIDIIFLIYSIDQNIFMYALENAEEIEVYKKLISNCKDAIKLQSITKPNDIIEMIDFTRNDELTVPEDVNEYILKLLTEGVLTEEFLIKSNFLRNMSSEQITTLCIEQKMPISLLLNSQSIKSINSTHARHLAKLGFFKTITPEEAEKLKLNGFLNSKTIIDLYRRELLTREFTLGFLGGTEEIAKIYRRFKRNKNKKDAKLYFDILYPNEVLDLYLHGKLSREELDVVDITKNDISDLDETDFIKLAKRGLPNNIEFSSDELIEEYLTRFSGKSLIELSKLGYIEPEKLLSLTEIQLSEDEKSRGIDTNDLSNLEISQDIIMDMYLDGDLTENQIIKFFNEGIFGLEELQTIFGENVLAEVSIQNIFLAYSKYNKVSIEELRELFDEYEIENDQRLNVVDLIGEQFDSKKLRELFENDILTHSDIMELQERGIITHKQLEEISKIDRERLYNEIFGMQILSESDDKQIETDGLGNIQKSAKSKQSKSTMISSKKREDYFRQIGKCDFRDIEARDTHGREAPFGYYNLIGYPEYGIVVFENFNKRDNATYIMTLQELKSYVIRENKDSILFKKSKKALREEIKRGRAVRVCHHTANWGHNVIKTIKELSKEAKQGISTKTQIRLSDMMRDEFKNLRLAQNGNNLLAKALIEKSIEVAKKRAQLDMTVALENEVEENYRTNDASKETEGEEHGEE